MGPNVRLSIANWELKVHKGSDVRRSKLLSGSASCDLCKSPISILQKKAIGELYPVVPVSSCAFNVCGSIDNINRRFILSMAEVMLILIFSHTNLH